MDASSAANASVRNAPAYMDSDESSSEVVGRKKKGPHRNVMFASTTNSVRPQGLVDGFDKKSLEGRLKVDRNLGLGVGMSETEFRARAATLGLPPEVCDSLVGDVHAFVKMLAELSQEEASQIKTKEQFSESLKNLPADRSATRQWKTTLAAGSTAYLTSFFFGKLALNLATIPTATSHGAWAFLIAGVLNPMVTEPIVQGIRASGAVYESPDGKAYMDFHTASLWHGNAAGDPGEARKWRKEMASIVTSVLHREAKQGIRRLGSGITEITYDNNGVPTSAKTTGGSLVNAAEAEQQVILWARRRAYVSDELPLFFFTLNYLCSGALAPTFRLAFPPWMFFAVDLGLSAALGTLSGMETATLQNALRANVQGARLAAQTPELKRATLSAAYAKRTIYEEKMARLKQVRALLIMQWEALRARAKDGEDVRSELKRLRECLREAKNAYRSVRKKYTAIKHKFNQHNTVSGRIAQSVEASMSTYMGEVGLKPNPSSTPSKKYKALGKLIGYPLSLVPVIAWSAHLAPWIVDAVYPKTGGASPLNISAGGVYSPEPESAPQDAAVSGMDPRLALQIGLGALTGIPLIVGFTLRQQYLSRGVEWMLAKAFGKRPVAEPAAPPSAQRPSEDDETSDEDAIVSTWSGDSDDDSEFDSDGDRSSDGEHDAVGTSLARVEEGKARQGKDRVTKVPDLVGGLDTDDDSSEVVSAEGSSSAYV